MLISFLTGNSAILKCILAMTKKKWPPGFPIHLTNELVQDIIKRNMHRKFEENQTNAEKMF